MSLTTQIIFIVILLHILIGVGWLMWKLSPRKGDQLIDSSDIEDSDRNKDE